MTLFRTHNAIAIGSRVAPKGALLRAGELSAKALAALLARGVVSELAPPPLSVLPGWQHRGERLLPLGITDASQLLEADVDEVARHMGVSPGLVRRWQAQLETFLVAPPEPHR